MSNTDKSFTSDPRNVTKSYTSVPGKTSKLGWPCSAMRPSVPNDLTDCNATVASSAEMLYKRPTYRTPLLEINEMVFPMY